MTRLNRPNTNFSTPQKRVERFESGSHGTGILRNSLEHKWRESLGRAMVSEHSSIGLYSRRKLVRRRRLRSSLNRIQTVLFSTIAPGRSSKLKMSFGFLWFGVMAAPLSPFVIFTLRFGNLRSSTFKLRLLNFAQSWVM